jgi:hypothetical protein
MRLTLLLFLGLSVVRIATAGVLPKEFFDERTGATVTVAHDALVFPVESPSPSPVERSDYVTLTAVQINRSGEVQLYLVAFDWSTGDRLAQPITLWTTERQLELVPLDEYPRDLPTDRQLLAAFSNMKRAAYRATPEMLAEMASSKHLKLRLNALPKSPDDSPDSGEVWQGAKALTAFVNFINSSP